MVFKKRIKLVKSEGRDRALERVMEARGKEEPLQSNMKF